MNVKDETITKNDIPDWATTDEFVDVAPEPPATVFEADVESAESVAVSVADVWVGI